MSSFPFHGPRSADASAGGCGVCDTVVLVCVACASCLIVFTVAICFRRVLADSYDAGPRNASAGAAADDDGAGRCGLAPSALASLPKLAYRRGAAGGWAQCAICLAVVRDGETVRLLPACGHLFHVSCIDPWLRSHATCPLCRRDVDGEAAAEKV